MAVRYQASISVQLRADGYVGKAFQQITRAKVDAKELERLLVKLQAESHMYPLVRDRSLFPIQRRRKLERVAADLRHAVAELSRNGGQWIFRLGDLAGETLGSTEPLEALSIIEKVADITQKALPRLSRVRPIPAAMPIGALVNQVKLVTGRPHYEQMSILIGAVYGEPMFTAERLKMLVSRQPR